MDVSVPVSTLCVLQFNQQVSLTYQSIYQKVADIPVDARRIEFCGTLLLQHLDHIMHTSLVWEVFPSFPDLCRDNFTRVAYGSSMEDE